MKRFIATIPALLLGTTAMASTSVLDIDTDNDDFATYDELAAVYEGLTAEQFEQIDTNNDNRVSPVEFDAPEAQQIISLYEGVELPKFVIDMNGDGFSDYEEISAVFTDLDKNEFDQMDTNDDNRLSQFEVYDIEAQNILNRYRSLEEVATIGKVDTDGDDFLSKSELMTAYPGLTETDFDRIDANDDNRVDFTEIYTTEAQNIVSRYES